MIKPLKYLEAKSIIEEINTDGHSPLKVLADEYETYYIKSGKERIPAFDMLNEYFCHYLLNLWLIPTPDIAAIKLDSELLNERGFSHYHKKHYYNQITFGSKQLPFSFELGHFTQIRDKIDFRKYLNPDVFLKIGLFDIWVENTDRKPSNFNILIQYVGDQLKVYAMDHAATFNCMNYKDLNSDPGFITNTYNESILYSQTIKEVIKQLKRLDLIKGLSEYFYFSVSECKHNFINIVKQIPSELGLDEELVVSLQKFLFSEQRNKAVIQEFLTRL